MTAIEELIYDRFEVRRVLVIAPKRVAEDTWTREAAKWDHLQELTISPVLGTAQERTAALNRDADLYVIGRDNVVWLIELLQKRKQFPVAAGNHFALHHDLADSPVCLIKVRLQMLQFAHFAGIDFFFFCIHSFVSSGLPQFPETPFRYYSAPWAR